MSDLFVNSEEIVYLQNRRKKLGGFLPARINNAKALEIPDIDIFDELIQGSDNRKASTTMVFVRLLTILTKDKRISSSRRLTALYKEVFAL